MAEHPFSDYLNSQPEPQRTTLLAVAATIRKLLPGAVECISYGIPAFKVDGTAVAGIAGFKNHCSYFPHSGGALEHFESELAVGGYSYNKATLRFAIDRPLPTPLIRKLIGCRLQMLSERPIGSGNAREFYDNGFLKSKGTIREDQLHGAWSWYRKDGSLMRTGNFKLGTQIGVWRTFDRAGRLVKETSF